MTKNSKTKTAASEVKAERAKKSKDKIRTLSSGYRVRMKSVAANIIREVQLKIKDPVVPTFPHPNDPELTVENPSHPDYLVAKQDVVDQRSTAAMDAMILFGLDLLDPIPEENEWLEKLSFMGLIDEKDLESINGYQRELYFKKFVVADATVVTQIAQMSGVTQEMIAEARDSFPGTS